jgi:anaerobic selenocysteine-containing dehydrogenase
MATKQDKISFKKNATTSDSFEMPQFEDRDKQTQKHTTCYMCACRCGIKVTLENNKIRYIEGTPSHPVNKGVLCAKGNAGIKIGRAHV